MTRTSLAALMLVALSALPAVAQVDRDESALRPSWASAKPAPKKSEAATDPEPTGIREVRATKDPIKITTKLRFTTMLELPPHDRILDVLNGDEKMWDTTLIGDNMVHLKPKDVGVYTNLMLVATSGTVYTFLLREGRADGKPLALPDIKVTVVGDEPVGASPVRKLYTAAEYEAVVGQLADARAQLDTVQRQADARVAEAKAQSPTVKFPYEIPYLKPFLIKAAYQDDRFTYFRSDARELPTLYEIKDGAPAVVEFKMPEPGLYVVPKLMDDGYFMLGKQRLGFREKKGTGN